MLSKPNTAAMPQGEDSAKFEQSTASAMSNERSSSPLAEPAIVERATSDVEKDSSDDVGSNRMDVDMPAWKGWAELENDPSIFKSILHSWGVRDVQVSEVIPLDVILEKEASSVLGLIFLSRWMPSESSAEVVEHPTDLWFANQISTFSCATLALMNIINNRNDVCLGEDLQTFKEKTLQMRPKERGLELDDFQVVKDIHNSFSRELDRMQVDLRLKDEVQASARKSKKSRKKLTKRKKRRHADEDDENGFHFVAYVPAQGHVWRLDGLESHPRDMGSIEAGETWLTKTITDLQTILETSEADDMEFSLLSLCHEPDDGGSAVEESRIARMKEDWSPFIAHMLKLHAEKGDLEDLLG